MEIKYICPYWGQSDLKIQEFVEKAVNSGYDGVEIYIQNDAGFIKDLMSSNTLKEVAFIAQQYMLPAIESFQEYRKKFNSQLRLISELNPVFINSHTGKDFFSFEENCLLIEDANRISTETGINIIHETHRGRFAFHLPIIIQYLTRIETLRLNADLSHLCVVSESLLEEQTSSLEILFSRTEYIHARVGSSQSAQVNNPFAPEWEEHLKIFLNWWQKIINLQASKKSFYICPEFGPEPYLAMTPYTKLPLADQWEVNVNMMNFLKQNIKL